MKKTLCGRSVSKTKKESLTISKLKISSVKLGSVFLFSCGCHFCIFSDEIVFVVDFLSSFFSFKIKRVKSSK